MKDLVETILEHHGVKGMKWGIRQKRMPKVGPSDDAKDALAAYRKARRSGAVALSNKELQSLNARLTLEKNYSELSAMPSRLAKAQAAVKTMVSVGKTYDSIAKLTGQKQVKEIFGAKIPGGSEKLADALVTGNAAKKQAKKAAKRAKKSGN